MKKAQSTSKVDVTPPAAAVPVKPAAGPSHALARHGLEYELVASADSVKKMNPAELVKWLEDKLGDRFAQAYREGFIAQKIDGTCFMSLNQHLLQEIGAGAPVGDRLYLMALKDAVGRASRIARRQHVIRQGKVFVEPPGVKGEFVLTGGSLKLTYKTQKKIAGAEGKTRVVDSTFVDVVDLASVEDVDFEQTTDVEVTVDVVIRGSCCWKSREEIETKKEMQCAKLYISLNTSEHSRESKNEASSLNMVLTVYDIEEGRALHQDILTARDELQVQVVQSAD
eukprot:c9180_g1_i2.p1 GENE.c9180_g1_i2~~c9180_g1_i2.p1  ORF type:complete len:291 (-),score=82.72 c9180_g1_i2:108-953(-)